MTENPDWSHGGELHSRYMVKNDVSKKFGHVCNGSTGNCYVKAIRYGGQEARDGAVDFAGDGPLEIVFAMGA